MMLSNSDFMANRAHLDFSEYLPYLINRVGSALVVDFVGSTLARPPEHRDVACSGRALQ